MSKRKKRERKAANAKKNLGGSLRVSRQKKQRWKGWNDAPLLPKESGLGWVYFVDIGLGWVKLGYTRQDVKTYVKGYLRHNPAAKVITHVQSAHAHTAESFIIRSLWKLKVKRRDGAREVYKLTREQVYALREVIKETMWINRPDIESWPNEGTVVGLLRGKCAWKKKKAEPQKKTAIDRRKELAERLIRQEEEIALAYIEAIK